MDLIKSGVPGMDALFKGGILANTALLVTGAPGTGKSIIALQFLIQGALEGDVGLYITSEEPAETLRSYAKNIGLDLEPYEKKGLLVIYEQPVTGKILSMQAPLQLIKDKKVKRVVLDSLTLFEYVYAQEKDHFEFRKGVLSFIADMKHYGITLLATAERKTTDIDQFHFQDQDFLFEGVIILSRIRKGATFERVITVAKMRGQDHLLDIFPIQIGKGGVKVLTKQIPFSLIEKEAEEKF